MPVACLQCFELLLQVTGRGLRATCWGGLYVIAATAGQLDPQDPARQIPTTHWLQQGTHRHRQVLSDPGELCPAFSPLQLRPCTHCTRLWVHRVCSCASSTPVLLVSQDASKRPSTKNLLALKSVREHAQALGIELPPLPPSE